MELLKKHHIPFKAKAMIGGREVDFIVGHYAIDIDGHEQDASKNEMLVNRGWIPIHYYNSEIKEEIIYAFNQFSKRR